MTHEQAMEKVNVILAHAWMVRAFLKHAEEIEEEEEMLQVHRTVFDFIRSVEPSYERKDANEYLRRLKGKLPKFRKAAEFFAVEYKNVSDHTNFEMAARSLAGCVEHIDNIIGQLSQPGQ